MQLAGTLRTLCVVLWWTTVAQASAYPRTWHVYPGPSAIQRAINAASPGDRIVVEEGTYPERLLIKKNNIALIGRNATLVPPTTDNRNDCSDFCGPNTEAGICITGTHIKADNFVAEHRKIRSVQKPVENTLLQGFVVQGFEAGPSVLIRGGRNVRIQGNKINGGANSIYGMLSAGSVDTQMSDNIVTALQDAASFSFVAACNDNFRGTEVARNDLSGYFIGLCIQTSGSRFRDNKVSQTCAGAYIDPFVENVTLENNSISDSYPACGAFGSWGVYISGAKKSIVKGNKIERITNTNGPSAGVAVKDDACSESSLACISNGQKQSIAGHNKVDGNSLHTNTLDLLLESKGSGNVFRHNECKTSDPVGLCHRTRGQF